MAGSKGDRRVREDLVGLALRSWRSLSDRLAELSEPEVARALEIEEANGRRTQVLRRLRQRLGRLRSRALQDRRL